MLIETPLEVPLPLRTCRGGRRYETGIAPAVSAAGMWLVGVADKVGTALTWTAAVDWVLSVFGDDEDEVQAALDERLTDNARLYLLGVELVNWQTSAMTTFTGSRLAAAMKGIEQGRMLVGDPESTLVTRQAVPKSLELLFSELRKEEKAATGSSPTPTPKPRPRPTPTPRPTPSWSPGAVHGSGVSTVAPASGASAAHAKVTGGGSSAWRWVGVAAAAGAGLWIWRKRR